MIQNKQILIIIPARGGSKGIPQKNIKLLNGIPLIAHSIKYAQSSQHIDNIIVSTDSEEIKNIALKYKVNIINRPENISGDDATTESVIDHTLNQLSNKPDIIILLQPTSPLRPEKSLNKALNIFLKTNCDSLLSISPTHRFFWNLSNNIIKPEYDYKNRPRRQDIKKEDIRYVENGSLYIFSYDHFMKKKNRLGGRISHIIFKEKYSYEIDIHADFLFIENLMNRKK